MSSHHLLEPPVRAESPVVRGGFRFLDVTMACALRPRRRSAWADTPHSRQPETQRFVLPRGAGPAVRRLTTRASAGVHAVQNCSTVARMPPRIDPYGPLSRATRAEASERRMMSESPRSEEEHRPDQLRRTSEATRRRRRGGSGSSERDSAVPRWFRGSSRLGPRSRGSCHSARGD